jgi:hypothetical protein
MPLESSTKDATIWSITNKQTIVIDDTKYIYGKGYSTFIVQVSLTIVTYNCNIIFIVKAIDITGPVI